MQCNAMKTRSSAIAVRPSCRVG